MKDAGSESTFQAHSETVRKRRVWLIEWMSEELFWKDVTKNVLSALIVAAFLAIMASALGLIDPSGWSVIVSLLNVLITVGLGFALFLLSTRLLPPRVNLANGKDKQPQTALITLAMFALLPTTFFLAALLTSLVARWLGLIPLIEWV